MVSSAAFGSRAGSRLVGAALIMLASALIGCTGVVAVPSDEGPPTPRRFGSTGWQCDPDRVPATPLRRLSQQELERTLRVLVGDEVFAAAALDFMAIPPDVQGTHAEAFVHFHSEAHAEALLATSETLADAYVANRARLQRDGFVCIVDDPSAACVDRFVSEFGRRAYRRPLTEDEVASYRAMHAEAPDSEEGFARVIMRMLLSPELGFHVEVSGVAEGDVLRLDPHVVASRIAYRVLGTMPPDALLEAAGRGELATEDDVAREVRALLDDPVARARVIEFFESWLQLDHIPGVPDEPTVLAELERSGLRDAMMGELSTFLETELFEREVSYRALMTSPRAYATDPRVASILDVPVWDGVSEPPETGTERRGLLLRPAMLLTDVHATAPVLRGVFVRREILCGALTSPGADVVNSRLDDLDSFAPEEYSSREVIELLTGAEPCATCHREINPISFALEEFDRLGRFRTVETMFRDGEVIAEHPLDTVVAPNIEEGSARRIASAVELADAIADSTTGHACLVQRAFEFAHVRPLTEDDECQAERAYTRSFDEDAPLVEVYVDAVVSEAVLVRRMEGPQ